MRYINLRLTYLLTNRHSSRVVAFLQAVAAALDGMSRLFVVCNVVEPYPDG